MASAADADWEECYRRTPGRASVTADLADYQPPAADLIFSFATLPFLLPANTAEAWTRIRTAVRSGGVLAISLFGDRGSWASGDSTVVGMTFHTGREVEGLFEDLVILDLEELEHDGPSGRGPKHWHRCDVIARRPAV